MYELERAEQYLLRVHRVRRGARAAVLVRACLAGPRGGLHRTLGRGRRPRPRAPRAADRPDHPHELVDRARPGPGPARRPRRAGGARRSARDRAARRPPAAARPRARGTCRGRVARRRRRPVARRGPGGVPARAREAAPLVRGRARVLAVEGGRARRAPGRGSRSRTGCSSRATREAAPRTHGVRTAARTRPRARSQSRPTRRPSCEALAEFDRLGAVPAARARAARSPGARCRGTPRAAPHQPARTRPS